MGRNHFRGKIYATIGLTEAASILAGFEALPGRFYLTIPLAALVGMDVAQNNPGQD